MKAIDPTEVTTLDAVEKISSMKLEVVFQIHPDSPSERHRLKELIDSHPFFDCLVKNDLFFMSQVPVSDRDRRATLVLNAAKLLVDAGYSR